MRYIDDVFLVIPGDMDIEEKVQNLIAADAKIQFTIWRDIPLTLARAFGKRFRPSVANVEGIWETIWT